MIDSFRFGNNYRISELCELVLISVKTILASIPKEQKVIQSSILSIIANAKLSQTITPKDLEIRL